jgi:hypothetical protein
MAVAMTCWGTRLFFVNIMLICGAHPTSKAFKLYFFEWQLLVVILVCFRRYIDGCHRSFRSKTLRHLSSYSTHFVVHSQEVWRFTKPPLCSRLNNRNEMSVSVAGVHVIHVMRGCAGAIINYIEIFTLKLKNLVIKCEEPWLARGVLSWAQGKLFLARHAYSN